MLCALRFDERPRIDRGDVVTFRGRPRRVGQMLRAMVPGRGLEPLYAGPKPAVLPLNDPGLTSPRYPIRGAQMLCHPIACRALWDHSSNAAASACARRSTRRCFVARVTSAASNPSLERRDRLREHHGCLGQLLVQIGEVTPHPPRGSTPREYWRHTCCIPDSFPPFGESRLDDDRRCFEVVRTTATLA